jgi:hypothetical protein
MPIIPIVHTSPLQPCPTASPTASLTARRRGWLLGALALAAPGAFAAAPGSAGA